MDEVPNLNTVAFFYMPDTRVQCGEEFEADCCVIWEEGFYKTIRLVLNFGFGMADLSRQDRFWKYLEKIGRFTLPKSRLKIKFHFARFAPGR